ncbi:MAG: aminopeptidase [Pseudomonadota bacterium]
MKYILCRVPLVVLLLSLSGCGTVGYYAQAAWGQWSLLRARVDVPQLLDDPTLPAATRQRLQVAWQIRDFAASAMDLAPDARYSTFVDLERPYVVWNVFVAPPFDLTAQTWCYPIVGCAPYRGYFREQAARDFAAGYSSRGYDTHVGGVPAYSTLGWFDDPLLSTFIDWPDGDLADLLLHELAHGRVWVNGDVTFNESFASFVGQEGARRWMQTHGAAQALTTWQQRRLVRRRLTQFLLNVKAQFQRGYALAADGGVQGEVRKAELLAKMHACYAAHRERLGGGRYDELVYRRVNNAYLVSVGTYADDVPAFAALFKREGEDWPRFFAAVEALAELPDTERRAVVAALAGSAQDEVGADADNDGTQQIDCEAFFGHGRDAEAPG